MIVNFKILWLVGTDWWIFYFLLLNQFPRTAGLWAISKPLWEKKKKRHSSNKNSKQMKGKVVSIQASEGRISGKVAEWWQNKFLLGKNPENLYTYDKFVQVLHIYLEAMIQCIYEQIFVLAIWWLPSQGTHTDKTENKNHGDILWRAQDSKLEIWI